MKPIIANCGTVLLLALFALPIGGSALGQTRRTLTNMGRGMGLLTPSLAEVGMQTKFFLTVAERIKATDEQKLQLGDIALDFQKLAGGKKADLAVAEAELQRMLARDQVDLAQVRAKLREIQSLDGDIEYAGVEAVLKAIKVLTHQQHLLIITLVSGPVIDKPRTQTQ